MTELRRTIPAALGRCSRRVVTTYAVVAAVLGMHVACGDDDAAGGGGGGGSATGATGATTANGPAGSTASGGGGAPTSCDWAMGAFPQEVCGECATTACCDELRACDADPSCGPRVRCFAQCGGDVGCLEACTAEHPEQPPALLAIGACLAASCPEACPPTCEDIVPPPDAQDREACGTCMRASCCDEVAAQQTADFLAWAQCSQSCADALCLRECELAHPGATDVASAANRCVFDEPCGESCQRSPGANEVCGGFSIGDPTCATCAREQCCAEDEACAFDVSCLNAFVCLQECYDGASCRACYEAWPAETMGTVLTVDGCVNAGCVEACTADGCGYAKHLVAASCEDCVRASCCAEQGACTDDAACAGLYVCTTVCDGDTACTADCEGRFPAAVAEHAALRACQAASCAEECGP